MDYRRSSYRGCVHCDVDTVSRDKDAGAAALDGGPHGCSSVGIIVVVVAHLPGCVDNGRDGNG